jgi:hypothetical protein
MPVDWKMSGRSFPQPCDPISMAVPRRYTNHRSNHKASLELGSDPVNQDAEYEVRCYHLYFAKDIGNFRG